MVGPTDSRARELHALKRSALKSALAGVILIGGWFLYSQLVPLMVRQAFQPLIVPHVAAISPSNTTTPLAPSRIPVASVAVGLSAEDSAQGKRAELQAATAAKQQKDRAWAA